MPRLFIIVVLTVIAFTTMACDPGAGVTWVNETDQTVLIYLGDEPNGTGTLLEPHSTKTEAVIKAVWEDVVVIRDRRGNILFRQEITWDELEAQDFRFEITEEMFSSTPAEDG